MIRKAVSAALFFLFLLFLASFSKCSVFPEPSDPEKITVLSYNACNLFDDIDNGTEYPEFDPSGNFWNSSLYRQRLVNTAEIIIKSSPPEAPDIICLQEIENKKVLKDLASTVPENCSYDYIVCADNDGSAITTGIISRYPVKEVRYHSLCVGGFSSLRPVTEALISAGEHRLYIFNCHFKSKLGGDSYTEAARIAAASTVRARCREILAKEPYAEIIVAGDLNENINEYKLQGKKYLTALFPFGATGEQPPSDVILYSFSSDNLSDFCEYPVFFSPWGESPEKGSYFYNGRWETIDHFLLSAPLFDKKGVEYRSFRVIDESMFSNKDGSPMKWISSLSNGYSDHFPILLELECR